MSTMRPIASSSRQAYRQASTSASTSAAAPPPIKVAVLLSRPPLLTPSAHPLESAYYAHASSIRMALSNPVPTGFYFKSGSLPMRRFQLAQHQREVDTFGPRLAGKLPDVGDVPPEAPVDEVSRDHWAQQDTKRGESSLERYPEEEVYCLIEEKGRWTFPHTLVNPHEGLDEAARRGILGTEGSMGGEGMDSWLVTRKPIAVTKGPRDRTFYLKSHILAGEPRPSNGAEWKRHVWLNAQEVEERLEKQGDSGIWSAVKGAFGRRSPSRTLGTSGEPETKEGSSAST